MNNIQIKRNNFTGAHYVGQSECYDADWLKSQWDPFYAGIETHVHGYIGANVANG